MQTILPHNSAILVAENVMELTEIFDTVTARLFDNIKEISFFSSGDFPHIYIFERNNILIIRYTGRFTETVVNIISDFFSANGFNF